MAADMADTRSSSTSRGSAEAMLRPSTLTTADASISGEEACNSRRRSTIFCVLVIDTTILHNLCETPSAAYSTRRATELAELF
jgi:hypothetical protein